MLRSARKSWILALSALPLILVFSVAGCGDGGGGDDGHAAGGPPRGTPGSMEQAVPVAVAAVRTGPIATYYKATTTLEAEKTAEVTARVTGIVETLLVEEGDIVDAGAPLLRIANDAYRLRVEQAAANTENLRARFRRFEAMLVEELTTEEEFQSARSDLASAEADEGLARLDLSYTTVTAPFAGRVTRRLVDVGRNPVVGEVLFEIGDFDPLLARVHVPSREFNKLQRNQNVDLVLDSNGARMQGRIDLISPIIDPTSGTIKLTVEVSDYPVGTRPGDFAEVRIVTERREAAVLVPRAAVFTEKGETVLYVAVPPGEGGGPRRGGRPGGGPGGGPGEHRGGPPADGPPPADAPAFVAERRVVEGGFLDDEHVEILDGVTVGELVVVKGQRSLKHGAALKLLEGGPAGAGR